VNGLTGTIAEVAARTTTVELWVFAAIAGLLVTLASLAYDHARLRRRHAKIEAELFENTVGKESTNWTNTALNLERKAKDPGIVARSTVMTHLHMLDEAANAWLKGSQWPDALRVTQELLRECCHAIIKPSINEDDFRATSDLIKRALERYPDLSKAANEAVENATDFLTARDATLSVLNGSALIQDLRYRLDEARAALEQKADRRARAA
jgi:Tfp pilus assembly protein PilE